MTVPGNIDTLLFGGAGAYQINQSLRFNSADSAYLNRTPASAGNRKTWTWSGWVKRASVSASGYLFVAGASAAGGTLTGVTIDSAGAVKAWWNSSSSGVTSSAVLRDPSAWYHVVASANNSTLTIYINNLQIVQAVGSGDAEINNVSSHRIGSRADGTGIFFDGYLTEINFIDGTALTPSSFGETDTITGAWIPKKYSGSYGTNGFHLDFADNSAATAAALGKDTSGNGNNWTPNNLSVTAGAGNDSLVDSPTNYGTDTGVGGEVRGNYATLNPLAGSTFGTLSDGNLKHSAGNTDFSRRISTIGMTSGKWYAEFTFETAGNNTSQCGVLSFVPPVNGNNQNGEENGSGVYNGQNLANNGTVIINGTKVLTGQTISGSGIVIGVALDADSNNVKFYRNGTIIGSSSGYSPANLSGTWYFVSHIKDTGNVNVANFGQRDFAYTPPTGFKALNTANLPEPSIKKGSSYFDTVLWTGNQTARTISMNSTFTPDFIWIKNRTSGYNHSLQDNVRGYGASTKLNSNTTTAENSANTEPQAGYISSVGAGSFSLDASATATWYHNNLNSNAYVAWCWDAGGAGSSNTAGTITSTVSANASAGFSIATYSANNTAGATFAHGLGVAPSMVIIKKRNASERWVVYHKSISNQYIYLNESNAGEPANAALRFGNNSSVVAPSSTLVTIGTHNDVNGASGTYVAYCFSEVAGYSKFGSYTGNGSTDGPFVFLGFRPKFLMTKMSSNQSNWYIKDTTRDTYNAAIKTLFPDTNDAESSESIFGFDFLSNGFKVRSSLNGANQSGQTFIYAAFAELPFKYANAR